MGGGVLTLRRTLPALAVTALVAGAAALALPDGAGSQQSASPSGSCDPIDPAHCLFPWPNDYFTVADPSTQTGRRVDLDLTSMPRNRAGIPINPADYNRSDGFSPGQMIVTKVPGLETQRAFERTGAVPITEIEDSFKPDAPIVVLNADTGERHLIWSELDANPQDPGDVALLIRPAVNFEEGGRYIVALRNLKDAQGRTIEAQRPFRTYRDRIPTSDPDTEARRPHFEEIFETLLRAGIKRKSLYLAWDFTVASRQNLTERMLHIRDDAFAQLGDTDLADMQVQGSPPPFSVSSTQSFAPCGDDGCQSGENDRIARRVEGTFTVPCYLDTPGCPTGSRYLLAPGSNTPTRLPGNQMSANFICLIPRSALDGADPPAARPSLYGHGLLGSASEIGAGNIQAMANEHNFTFCATDWAGFSTTDVPTVLTILQDLSNFPKLVDRTQQGWLNFLYLGRLMIHPDGFASDPAFQVAGRSVIDTSRLFYDGNSQGGILGGGLTAVAPDFSRAVLGVPGMNYSTLLRRSSDFPPYAEGAFGQEICQQGEEFFEQFGLSCDNFPDDTPLGLYDNYPDELERPLILSMIQMLWDRGEANGYAHHMTSDPLPGTPAHNVLLHVAFGDHQVTQWAAEVEARTIGASVHWPALDEGRHPDDEGPADDPLFGIPRIGGYPFGGSALVYWDSTLARNVFPPPTTNTPPTLGDDPHGHPRADPDARRQKSAFLDDPGAVIDVCGGGPCYADGN
jgi:hypothetical protein